MLNEINMLLEQRDVCRRFSQQSVDPATQAQFLAIADQYENRAAIVRAQHSAWTITQPSAAL